MSLATAAALPRSCFTYSSSVIGPHLSAALMEVNSAALSHENGRPECNRGVKVVEEVRRERLLELREEFGSLAELNEALGFTRTDSTLSQIINRSANSKTATPKTMGSQLARDLEAAAQKPRGWMDTDPAMGWPFENLTRGRFDRLTERQKGAVEMAALEAIQKLGITAAEPAVPAGDEPGKVLTPNRVISLMQPAGPDDMEPEVGLRKTAQQKARARAASRTNKKGKQ